jgi:hypothetical protein
MNVRLEFVGREVNLILGDVFKLTGSDRDAGQRRRRGGDQRRGHPRHPEWALIKFGRGVARRWEN